MPNWNSNTIVVDGPADKIRALWTAAQPAADKDGSLLEAMVPIGEWVYDTAVNAWGTKWDVSLEGLQLIEGDNGTASIQGYADSAWSPPIEAFQTYAAANPDVFLSLKYFEPGMSFIGQWDSEAGDDYWEDVGSLLETTAESDPFLYELMEEFNVWDWYDFDEEEDETAEEIELSEE